MEEVSGNNNFLYDLEEDLSEAPSEAFVWLTTINPTVI